MDLSKFDNIYFIGIGGIGMSAIARYFKLISKNVAGYDRTQSHVTNALGAENIRINFIDQEWAIPKEFRNPENCLIVYTPAVPENNAQYVFFRKNKFTMLKRAKVLGLLSKYKRSIGIAGTHGKTTISTITSHIFKSSQLDCSAFIGGIARNYNSNFLFSPNSDFMILEADEFDRSFLNLNPEIALVSSMDADHLDIYNNKKCLEQNFQEYVNCLKPNGLLIYKKGLKLKTSQKSYSYSLDDSKADFYAKNISLDDGNYIFDLVYPNGEFKNLHFSYPGLVNVENAIAASAIAILSGVNEIELNEALANFQGVYRRFDYQIKSDELVYIDDYAHHPTELDACINSVKKMYPDKKICGIFQPHLYSRTRDFANEFAESLNLLDELVLLDIYPAREEPIPGVSSEIIMKNIKKPVRIVPKDDLIDHLHSLEFDVLLSLGAGDIDKLVNKIKQSFDKE